MKSFAHFNESVRDKMTPKSDEDIKYTIKGMIETEPVRFFKHDYLERSYDYETLSKFVTDKEIFNGMLKMCENIPPLIKGDSILPKEKLARMMLYLFKNDYIYTETDSLGISWFKHNGKSRHGSEFISVSGYTIMDNLKMYIKRAKE